MSARGASPEIVRSVKSLELQRSLVANGFGVALVHTLPQATVSYDGMPIRAIPVADRMIEQRVQIVCLEQNRERPVLKAALQEVETLFTRD